jgi:hypothetical protein
MKVCWKRRCNATGTLYPRVMFRASLRADAVTNMRMIFDAPVCDEHRSPFVEEVIRTVSKSPLSDLEREIGDHFFERYGVRPKTILSQVDYLQEDHPDIIEWFAEVERQRQDQPAHLRNKPIIVQHVSYDEFAHYMSLYPDIAVKP